MELHLHNKGKKFDVVEMGEMGRFVLSNGHSFMIYERDGKLHIMNPTHTILINPEDVSHISLSTDMEIKEEKKAEPNQLGLF